MVVVRATTKLLGRLGIEAKILAFIDDWNEISHPFNWTAKSFEKVLKRVDDPWVRRPHWTDVFLKAAA